MIGLIRTSVQTGKLLLQALDFFIRLLQCLCFVLLKLE